MSCTLMLLCSPGGACGGPQYMCNLSRVAAGQLESGGSMQHPGQRWKADGANHRDKREQIYPK